MGHPSPAGRPCPEGHARAEGQPAGPWGRSLLARARAQLRSFFGLRPHPHRRAGTADALGRRGERAAVRALRRAGYRILARRWKARGGEEVDVVALHGETIVIVEVKATASATAAPGDRIDHRKRERLRTAAGCLLRKTPGGARPVRIDVVEVRLEGRGARATIRPGHTRLS